MKTKKTFLNLIKKIIQTGKFNTDNTLYDRALSWLDTGTSIQSGGGKLVLLPPYLPLSYMMPPSCMCLTRVNTILNLTYNWENQLCYKERSNLKLNDE